MDGKHFIDCGGVGWRAGKVEGEPSAYQARREASNSERWLTGTVFSQAALLGWCEAFRDGNLRHLRFVATLARAWMVAGQYESPPSVEGSYEKIQHSVTCGGFVIQRLLHGTTIAGLWPPALTVN